MNIPGTTLSLVFTHGAQLLATSSSGSVRLFDPQNSSLLSQLETSVPILAAVASKSKSGAVYLGQANGSVAAVDFENGALELLGTDRNSSPIVLIVENPSDSSIVSAALDGTVQSLDPRNGQIMYAFKVDQKPICMDIGNSPYLAIGMTQRTMSIYDARFLAKGPVQERESGLKLQMTKLACRNDGYAVASVDGRVAIEYFDPSELAQSLKYAFKCHRTVGATVDDVFPVIGLQYHNELLYTAGNNTVCLWNYKERKRLKQYRFKGQVTAIAVDDGVLAATVDDENDQSCIYIKEI